MSFDQNQNMITTGNYEEFFVLYMDNELSAEQVKMVEAFLLDHPHLKAELDLLMSTKLPVEEFSFDKTELLAENMKLSAVDEELLLYIDNELEPDTKKKVELELASNEDYQLQHRVLMQAKLNPSEIISYPDKKELYRHTERVVVFKVWMRVAAAVVVIAAAGILYFNSNSSRLTDVNPPQVAKQNQSSKPSQTPLVAEEPIEAKVQQAQTTPASGIASVQSAPGKNMRLPAAEKRERPQIRLDEPAQEKLIAFEQPKNAEPETVERTNKVRYDSDAFDAKDIVSTNLSKDLINTQGVTSLNPERPVDEPVADEGSYGNDRKGSVRGFLRRATRLIEKRTGFDPTNENGELLIGAVAISLK